MSEKLAYAVIKSGASQVRVVPGQKVCVDRLPGKAGDAVTLSNVILACAGEETKSYNLDKGQLKGATVNGKIVRHVNAPKVIVFKKRRTTGYTKKQGHRQKYTEVMVDSIQVA